MMIMNEVVYGRDQVENESSFEKASIKPVSLQHYMSCSRYRRPHELAYAHLPRSSFLTGASGEMSKSKISFGRPMVVQEFGTSTMPAT